MGIGASVLLLVVGAIITFAFNVRVGWLDLDIVGWVLMAAGAFGLILGLTTMNRSRRRITRTATTNDPYAAPPAGERVVQESSTYDVDRPL
jgi:hypothetical protein